MYIETNENGKKQTSTENKWKLCYSGKNIIFFGQSEKVIEATGNSSIMLFEADTKEECDAEISSNNLDIDGYNERVISRSTPREVPTRTAPSMDEFIEKYKSRSVNKTTTSQ